MSVPSVVLITQARLGSTRLPGKILKTVLGKSLLEYQIERLNRVPSATKMVVATTTNEDDKPIVDLCEKLNVACFRGSVGDVLARYHGAALAHKADIVVRVTSDCPLIDPNVIDRVIQTYLSAQPTYDYVSNCLERTYPRGMDTEVFSFRALDEAFREATALPDREHVTPFLYRQPGRYRLGQVTHAPNQSTHRWTVDTVEDFTLIQNIIESLYPSHPTFTIDDCFDLLTKNPSWVRINQHIEQKQYGE